MSNLITKKSFKLIRLVFFNINYLILSINCELEAQNHYQYRFESPNKLKIIFASKANRKING